MRRNLRYKLSIKITDAKPVTGPMVENKCILLLTSGKKERKHAVWNEQVSISIYIIHTLWGMTAGIQNNTDNNNNLFSLPFYDVTLVDSLRYAF